MPSGESAPANGFLEWEVPREAPDHWNDRAGEALKRFWEARIGRQRGIDACIAARAEYEYLYDKPYEDNAKTRVAGPFTVESLSPHRLAALDENDELVLGDDRAAYAAGNEAPRQDFAHMVLENLRTAGDPYKSLKTTLKAEIDPNAWDTLHSDTSRPFPKPSTGRIAVKVINHLGDEVMKVFGV